MDLTQNPRQAAQTPHATPHMLAAQRSSADAPREAARAAAASGATFAAVPYSRLMGLRREAAAAGVARVRADDDPALHDRHGCLGRAVLMALLDTAMASAAIASVDFTHTALTLDLSASFVARRPGPLTADARVVACDERVLFCEAEVHDAGGAPVARGRGCFRLVPHA
ncbi:MAG: PaaI family thioesterase [Burkholderiales bacterium]|nr:PaaI family thioesterase [Burkholderiales bacterium]